MIDIRKQIEIALKQNKEKEINLDEIAKRRNRLWTGKYGLCYKMNIESMVIETIKEIEMKEVKMEQEELNKILNSKENKKRSRL